MATFNLNILPIHRNNGQESAELPGLLALTPPRKTARGRERDYFVAYLLLSGNTTLTPPEQVKLVSDAAGLFYQTHGPLTSAMRKAAEQINVRLLERNLTTTSRGEYTLGHLVLAAIRESQCTLLLSGPTHAVWVSDGRSRHVYEPALSGKGLGAGQSLTAYLSQIELHPQDLLALCGTFPRDWEADLINERPPASLDASYRKLTFTKGDLNAVLIQAQSGHGIITLLRPDVSAANHRLRHLAPSAPTEESPALPPVPTGEPGQQPIPVDLSVSVPPEEPNAPSQASISEEKLDALADLAAHIVQPSAYAIPPQPEQPPVLPTAQGEVPVSSGARGFPSSIPRVRQPETPAQAEEPAAAEAPVDPPAVPAAPGRARRRRERSAATRQIAKTMVGGIQTGRRMSERIGMFFRQFLPRLLPGSHADQPFALPTYALIFIAVVIPVAVVTVASIVYLRFGQSIQYDELFAQARTAKEQALSETDPIRQRDAWQRVIDHLDSADKYRTPEDSTQLRREAQFQLDILLGDIRLEFRPAFTGGLGNNTQISRMAASESDLYMLDATSGKILHASYTAGSLSLDTTFSCEPGSYGGYQVGPLVDLLALPKVNAVNASVMGIDATGTLLYCAPNQVPQAIPLPALPNTNWGRITSMTLDSGNLYVLDAQLRAVWVFVGKDTAFVDEPYFYFGNDIPATIDSAIDIGVISDDLYLLHTDGHLSTCTFSRLSEVPTRCQDPAPRVDNYLTHRDMTILQDARFTQMSITSPPNSVILLLDSASQSVFRFSPRSFELQSRVTSQAGAANPFPPRVAADAMAVSPNYVLYLAIDDQVYLARDLP